jgi:prevent-host-death family protein
MVTRISSRECNQNASGTKRPVAQGPVDITDRGRPAHVLLAYEDYERLLVPMMP